MIGVMLLVLRREAIRSVELAWFGRARRREARVAPPNGRTRSHADRHTAFQAAFADEAPLLLPAQPTAHGFSCFRALLGGRDK